MPEQYDPMFLPALGGPTRAWQIARMIVDAYDKQRLTQPDCYITAVDHLDELSRIVYTRRTPCSIGRWCC